MDLLRSWYTPIIAQRFVVTHWVGGWSMSLGRRGCQNTNVGIIDTAGEVRWWLFDTLIGDPENPWYSGYFMCFQ